jgi:hypothetical protein
MKYSAESFLVYGWCLELVAGTHLQRSLWKMEVVKLLQYVPDKYEARFPINFVHYAQNKITLTWKAHNIDY